MARSPTTRMPAGRRTALLLAVAGSLALAACGGSSSDHTSPSSSAAGSTLPRTAVVPLSVVSVSFPDVTQEASTGADSTAVGTPKATRSVIYGTADGSKKVTLTVGQYASSAEAMSTYEQALQKSEVVPGFAALPAPNVGQRAFAGTVTMNGETHIGLGVLEDTLIVGATTAGYPATPDITGRLRAVLRAEAALATSTVR